MDQDHKDYAEREDPIGKVPRRLRVIGPGVVTGIVLSGLFCVFGLEDGRSIEDRTEVFGHIIAGPFTALAYEIHGVSCWSLIALLASPAIFAHPVRPNRATGVLTALALTLWFFSGWLAIHVMLWGA
jgi:hypothetical protein